MKAKFIPIEMTMLVDSGASHSFVNPKFISRAMKSQIREWLDSKHCAKFGVRYLYGKSSEFKRRSTDYYVAIAYSPR